MERYVEPFLVPDPHQQVVDPGDVVGVAGEGGAEDGGDADRVLVDVGLDVLRPDHVLVLAQADDPRFDVEVAAELFPDDVDVAAEDEVRLLDSLAFGFAPLLPLPLQRQRPEHDRLRRALGAAAGRLPRSVVEVGEHADAALLDLGASGSIQVVTKVARLRQGSPSSTSSSSTSRIASRADMPVAGKSPAGASSVRKRPPYFVAASSGFCDWLIFAALLLGVRASLAGRSCPRTPGTGAFGSHRVGAWTSGSPTSAVPPS